MPVKKVGGGKCRIPHVPGTASCAKKKRQLKAIKASQNKRRKK